MSQKKFGKSLQPLQSNAESLGNIRALDGYEPGCNMSVAVVCSFQFHLSSVQCSSVTSAVLCMPVSGRLDNKCRKKSLGKVCSLCSQMLRAQETSGLSMAMNQTIDRLSPQPVVIELTIQLALDETAGQSAPGKERGFQSLVTESPKDIALEILNSLSYCHHPHHRIRRHLPDQALLDHHPVHCHHIPVRQSMFLIHLLDHLKTCLQKIAHPHQ